MAKYLFRLKTLLKLREARRDQQRTALAEAYRAEQVLAEKRRALVGEQAELRDVQRSAAAGRYMDVNRLLESLRYELVLRSNEQELSRQEKLLAVEIERRRLALVEADRSVRTLELLDERHRRQHSQRQQRLENKSLDEAASIQQACRR
jgi:flagellar export protein FliJ